MCLCNLQQSLKQSTVHIACKTNIANCIRELALRELVTCVCRTQRTCGPTEAPVCNTPCLHSHERKQKTKRLQAAYIEKLQLDFSFPYIAMLYYANMPIFSEIWACNDPPLYIECIKVTACRMNHSAAAKMGLSSRLIIQVMHVLYRHQS